MLLYCILIEYTHGYKGLRGGAMNKRKKSIVKHALALFLEKGIQKTSIQDIIERAGISKGTFYNYFASKNECVGAILEQIRYDASQSRSELLIGKDAKDPELLIQEISILAQLNEKQGMASVFEEILHSGDKELQKMVLNYRIAELEWLSERFIEIFGEELRPYAFESSVIFYGMLQHLLFTRKLIHQSSLQFKTVASSAMHYMKFIVREIIHSHTAVLDKEKLGILKDNLINQSANKSEAIEMLNELTASEDLTKAQLDLSQALLYELEQDHIRDAVVLALLHSFVKAFEDAPKYKCAKEISSKIWYFLKRE